MWRKYLLAALVGVLALAVAGVAIAGTKNDVTFETKYSTTVAKKSSGFKTVIKGAPRDAAGELDPANRVIVTFQKGTVFNTNVPKKCTVSILNSKGPAGCPTGSQVGKGEAHAITGLGGAVNEAFETITAFNTAGGILFYLQPKPGKLGTKLVLKGTLRLNKLTVVVPKFDVGTPKGAVLDEFLLTINRITRSGKNYVTTPTSCRTGRWQVKATFQYPNVPDITNIVSTTRCRKTS